MKIERLYLGDFGIFKNANMDGIGSSIVLIGGGNRAGKSTLMEALRCLAYGIQKNGDIPPSNVEYILEGDIKNDAGEEFNIKIQGFGEPKLYPLSGASTLKPQKIYNIDRYSYKEIYTISLDELNNISKSDSKLQTLLLGAGYKDAANLPEIIKEFLKEAERIGGKRGNPSTKMFKSYSTIISDAVKDKEDALKESSEYTEKESRLHRTIEEIRSIKEELGITDNSLIVLDVLKENYEDIKRYREINIKLTNNTDTNDLDSNKIKLLEARNLKTKYVSLLKDYNENISTFKKSVNTDLSFKDRLVENKNIIQKLEVKISGFKEKLRAYSLMKSKWEEDKKSIIVDIHRVNESFNGSFKEVMAIKCDELEIGELNKLDSDIREAEHSIDEWNNKKVSVSSQIRLYEETAKNDIHLKKSPLNFSDLKLMVLPIINIIILVYAIKKTNYAPYYFAIITFILIITVFSVYFATKQKSISTCERIDISNELLKLKSELEAAEISLKDAKDKKNNNSIKLDYYRKILRLNKNTPPITIKDNLILLQNIKNRIIKLSLWKKELEEIENSIKKDSISILALFTDLGVPIEKIDDMESLYTYAERFEEIAAFLPIAILIEDSFHNLQTVKNDIHKLVEKNYEESKIGEILDEYIGKCIGREKMLEDMKEYETLKKSLSQVVLSERVKNGLLNFPLVKEDVKKPFLILLNIFIWYSGPEEINIEYERLKLSKELLSKKLDDAIKQSERLKNEINGILVSDKIRCADEIIYQAKGGMRPIAEKYAVYAAAACILNRVYRNFMDKTQNNLLKGSSDILKCITGDEYIGILPPNKVESIDFRTRLQDGSVLKNTKSLSRATREQLFLSVRINRIKQNESSLPIIIDDSFVNFDTFHLNQTLEIISELSKTNQIFILTCHPYMVEFAGALNKDIQYWRLEKGRFFNSDNESLQKFLSFH